MTPNDLTSAGMGTKDATAYLALLELGEASMSELVKKTKLKRTTLYDTLDSLKDKKLVSLSKKGKRVVYIAESPKKLLEKSNDDRLILEKILPELLSIANNITTKPKVRYFEGTDGIKEVYRDILRHPHQKIQAWAPESIVKDIDVSFFDDFYTPKLIEQKMLIELIAPDVTLFQKHKEENTVPTRKIKLVNANDFPFFVEITLYGQDKIGIMSYRDQMGLVIESEPIRKTLKSIFELQWVILPL